MFKIFFGFLLVVSFRLQAQVNYWEWDIPVPNKAVNIEKSTDELLFSKQLSFDIKTKNLDTIYDFYNEEFLKIGWLNPYAKEEPPVAPFDYSGKWGSYRITATDDGSPVAYYGSVWRHEDVNVNASVAVEVHEWKDNVFKSAIKVSFVPEVDTSPMFEIQSLMARSPQEVFSLYHELGFLPMDFVQAIENRPHTEKMSDAASEYYEIIDRLLANYKKFGENNGLVD